MTNHQAHHMINQNFLVLHLLEDSPSLFISDLRESWSSLSISERGCIAVLLALSVTILIATYEKTRAIRAKGKRSHLRVNLLSVAVLTFFWPFAKAYHMNNYQMISDLTDPKVQRKLSQAEETFVIAIMWQLSYDARPLTEEQQKKLERLHAIRTHRTIS